jgi:hypothetical protein
MHTAGNHIIDAQVLSHQQAVNDHKFCFKGSKISLYFCHTHRFSNWEVNILLYFAGILGSICELGS